VTEKLVRDRIPEIAAAKGQKIRVRRASPAEMPALLRAKLSEECREAMAAKPDELLNELADLVEVAQALAQVHGHDAAALEAAQRIKRQHRGGFTQRIVLDLGAVGASG
jgi:predicted house-cleaning noncanonical NTP pyrophosphatase (MazG superfamily)